MKKGFTLIELVIVIGILAVLAAAVVLVLNPAQLLMQARDSQRMSDLASVKSAVGLYLATYTGTPSVTAGPFSTAQAVCPFGTCTVRANYSTGGSGWVAIDLTGGGTLSPAIASLPIDPSNTGTTTQYSYKGNASTYGFKVTGFLESAKYSPQMSTDGGTMAGIYEVGTDMSL